MRGMTIQLVEQTTEGYDAFGAPIVTGETLIDIDDVLVGQPTADDITTSVSLYGKKCVYKLGIPRTDSHEWADHDVVIYGKRYRTIGEALRGIDANVPTRWNRTISVERYT